MSAHVDSLRPARGVAGRPPLLLRWEVLVSLIVLTVLWIPLGRYAVGGGLPVNLEPYRLLVTVVVICWCATLLVDPSIRWKRVGLFGPILALVLAVLASNAVNARQIDHFDVLPDVLKAASLLASWIAVMLLVASVLRTREQLDLVVKVLVIGGAVVAGFAVVQYRTGFNVFDHLGYGLLSPISDNLPSNLGARGDGSRVYASAQHPIALSAALVVLLPLGIYAGRRFGGRVWWLATAMIGIGALTTVARTGATMLLTVLIVLVVLKPREVIPMWKWGLPFLVAVFLLSPGVLGGLKAAFLPEGGLVAEQEAAYSEVSSNRLADVGPTLEEWAESPIFGHGYGARVADPNNPNANGLILDDQWLGLLLDAGLVGAVAFLWLFVRSYRRLAKGARATEGPDGWLLAGLAASIAAFAIGMVTFDAFSFVQATFLLFVLIGLSVPALRFARSEEPNPG